MNTSLAIQSDISSERPSSAGNGQPVFKVVASSDAHRDDSFGSSVLTQKPPSPDAQPVVTPATIVIKHLPGPLSDVEHLASQLDVEKVLLVPAGVTVTGDIDTNGLASLVISGTVNGSVKAGAGAVIVRESGVVLGSIQSDESVVVAGQVTNPDGPAIVTSGLWLMAETARVRGDVAYARHRAYEGAVFSGRAIPFSEFKA